MNKNNYQIQSVENIPRCTQACSEMHTFEPNCLQHISTSEIDTLEEVNLDIMHRNILGQCYQVATLSPDKSTQLGTVIVNRERKIEFLTYSYNGFCMGWEPTIEDYERPRKYSLTVHAERRAIYKAANAGIALHGCTLYGTWAACTDCAQAIVESGITKLVRHYPPDDEAVQRWLESVQLGDELLKAGGVNIIDVHGPIPDAPSILRNGELYDPSK